MSNKENSLKRINVEQSGTIERGTGTDLLGAAIGGVTGGVAGAVTTQVIAKVTPKAKKQPAKKK
jgi:hypothetical protein